MKRFLLAPILLSAIAAHGYEYKLQFTPQGGAQGLVVAGYEFNGRDVVGNCSYYVVTSGSGRGGHSIRTNHYNTCTWDLYGNLLSMNPGEPAIPQPRSETGTEIVYAIEGTSKTGQDTRGFGFVSTPSAHYSWTTGNGGYADIPYADYKVTANLISDGDFTLEVAGERVTTGISGTITPSPGTATVSAKTCGSSLAVGRSCSVTVTYNPTTIGCTGDPYGYAYTNLSLALVTDAGATIDFTEGFTVTGVPICDD